MVIHSFSKWLFIQVIAIGIGYLYCAWKLSLGGKVGMVTHIYFYYSNPQPLYICYLKRSHRDYILIL